ncbi:MAG: acyltransferase family protein [Herminiimonas sp.]|uniref:acyltransferase family protein n=1 Tax=Herminiimonas sp. TaxID=1926289 RepID=UPI0027284725|nr:acyltransferase family protein [Herminiimonas sp.]MDO9419021.1 acyltransferase family protein [Herminiimonas sp.]
MNKKYVPEYDGLRALAVLGVVFYHFGFKYLPGGFVGVDVFFVISGFLISRIILIELDEGKFSLIKFYERRFRRIAPALIVVLTITTLLFSFINFPSEFGGQQKSLAAALFSFSNIYFYYTTDYFQNNEFNPFLHTWSLAVEEQFYLVFPLILIALRRLDSKNRFPLLFVIGFVSLIAACLYVYVNASAAFYLPWLRAWELLMGTAIAVIGAQRFSSKTRIIFSYLGVGIILFSFVSFDAKMRFPGASAILPVVAAALVILGSGIQSLPNTILASRFPVFVGKVSYSLYLVHWPIACLFATFGLLDGARMSALGVFASAVGAWLSYRFIEQRFRYGSSKSPVRTYWTVLGCSVGVFCIGLMAGNLANSLWSSPQALALSKININSVGHLGNPACFLTSRNSGFSEYDQEACLSLSGTKENILIIGDSHSAHFMGSIKKLYPEANIMQSSASGCIPLLDAQGAERCTSLFSFMYTKWLPENAPKIKYVIISARWVAANAAGLEVLSNSIKKMGSMLVVLGPTPEYRLPLPKILALKEVYGIDLVKSLSRPERLQADLELERLLPPTVKYYSAAQKICSISTCAVYSSGVPSFFDKDHLTLEGADAVLEKLPLCLNVSNDFCMRKQKS